MTDFRALCKELINKIDYTWGDIPLDVKDLITRARAALNTPPFVPIPVSERLPEKEDLHPEEGWCWYAGKRGIWYSLFPPAPDDYSPMTHWLPYWAIPLPEVQE